MDRLPAYNCGCVLGTFSSHHNVAETPSVSVASFIGIVILTVTCHLVWLTMFFPTFQTSHLTKVRTFYIFEVSDAVVRTIIKGIMFFPSVLLTCLP